MRFQLVSPIMAYSVCVYGVMMWGLWVAHGHEARTRHYDDSVVAVYHLVLLLLVVFLPFTYWRDASTVGDYISIWWPRFQVTCRHYSNAVRSMRVANLPHRNLIIVCL
jgi:hypothetical protein